MKEPSIKKNYLFNASYQLLALIVPLITTPYISRVLSADGIGIHSYTFSIVSFFTLFSALGTATYATRMLGIHRADIEERSKVFWDVFVLRALLSTISIVVYLTYVFLFAENKFIAALQAIHILGVLIDVAWFFQGMENFKIIAIRNFFIKLVNIIFIFTMVRDKGDLWWYVFGLSFWTLLANLTLWPGVKKYIRLRDLKSAKPFKDITVIIQLFVPTIAVQVYAILDKAMIGWISGDPSENGYYEQSEKIVKMCLMLITALGAVTIPRISRLYAQGKKELVQRLIYRSYRFVWALGCAMMFGLIGVNNMLVPVFFGPGFEKVEILLPILSILFLLMGINNATGVQYLISTGRQKAYMYIVVIGGIVNIGVNGLMIPFFGSVGAAIGSVMGELVILIVEFVYVYRIKAFKISRAFAVSRNYLIAGIIMLVVTLLAQRVLPNNLIGLMVLICVGAVCYGVVLLIFKDEFLFKGLDIVKVRIKKIKNH